jgi:hypothetical protein
VRRQIIIAGLTVVVGGCLLGLLLFVGQLARLSLRTDERYQFPFQSIDCPAPLGQDRESFLAEVRYYGNFPEQLSLVDDDLSDRLQAAFSRHPWVESVERIQIGPGRRLRVRLKLRTPVLGVVWPDGTIRAVDRFGILLPRGADTHALPLLTAPSTPAGLGKPWGDPRVEGAAAVAHALAPYQDRLQLRHFRFEGDDLHLRRDPTTGPVVIWGPPAGAKDDRVRRLLDLADHWQQTAGLIDLR